MDFIAKKEELISKNPFMQSTDLAYRLLLDGILSGRIEANELLSQSTLATQMDMSRTPVRDALAKLQEDGFVVKEAGQYYSVTPFRSEDFIQIMDFRSAIECHSARSAAMFITAEQLNQVGRNMVQLKDNGASMSLNELIECDMAFHRLIVLASANKYLIETYQNYETLLRFYRRIFMNGLHLPSVYHSILQRHQRIYRAIFAHDEDAAEDAMRKHLDVLIHKRRE